MPDVTYDEDWEGMADEEFEGKELCEHWEKMRKYVCFEGKNLGRRFLGCANQKEACSKVTWVDPEWPPRLQNCLMKLWGVCNDEKSERIRGSIESAERYFKLVKEKEEVEQLNKKLQEELSASITEHHTGMVGKILIDSHKLLKEKACKERDVLKEEKRKLEYYVSELLKNAEVNKDKLQKIKDLLNE